MGCPQSNEKKNTCPILVKTLVWNLYNDFLYGENGNAVFNGPTPNERVVKYPGYLGLDSFHHEVNEG